MTPPHWSPRRYLEQAENSVRAARMVLEHREYAEHPLLLRLRGNAKHSTRTPRPSARRYARTAPAPIRFARNHHVSA